MKPRNLNPEYRGSSLVDLSGKTYEIFSGEGRYSTFHDRFLNLLFMLPKGSPQEDIDQAWQELLKNPSLDGLKLFTIGIAGEAFDQADEIFDYASFNGKPKSLGKVKRSGKYKKTYWGVDPEYKARRYEGIE